MKYFNLKIEFKIINAKIIRKLLKNMKNLLKILKMDLNKKLMNLKTYKSKSKTTIL